MLESRALTDYKFSTLRPAEVCSPPMPEPQFDPERPVCRQGIVAQELVNRMIYIRHPRFSSRIINRESWGFIQLCDGRDLEQLKLGVAELLGFSLTHEQLGSSIREFSDRGVFVGTSDSSRNYRICNPMPLITRCSPVVKWLATRWFAILTFLAFLACLGLLIFDWSRFTGAVVTAVREHPVETLLLYYITFIPIALLHELGHAAVVNFFGGEVPEIVICSNANFAVITNMTVLKDRQARIWYLSMGTVVDVAIWLALLITFHYYNNYLVIIFLLPQTIYFLIYVYSIFKNSDYLKVVCAALNEPVPARPWQFLKDSWVGQKRRDAKSKLVWVMTVSLMLKLVVTAFLIVTFMLKEPRVLALYVVYRVMVLIIGRWPLWWRRLLGQSLGISRVDMKPGPT